MLLDRLVSVHYSNYVSKRKKDFVFVISNGCLVSTKTICLAIVVTIQKKFVFYSLGVWNFCYHLTVCLPYLLLFNGLILPFLCRPIGFHQKNIRQAQIKMMFSSFLSSIFNYIFLTIVRFCCCFCLVSCFSFVRLPISCFRLMRYNRYCQINYFLFNFLLFFRCAFHLDSV